MKKRNGDGWGAFNTAGDGVGDGCQDYFENREGDGRSFKTSEQGDGQAYLSIFEGTKIYWGDYSF